MPRPIALAPALLMIADGRFPAGGHAHSGGLEEAVAAGAVTDVGSLALFLDGRLRSVGLTEAALAAATAARAPDPPWDALIAEATARCASPALRRVAAQLGRQLLRAAVAVWPDPLIAAARAAAPPLPIALGAVIAAVADDDRDTHNAVPEAAATVAVYHAAAGPAAAAVRLLGLDPVAVQAVVARLDLAAVATTAAAAAHGRLADLPGPSSTALELGAEVHAHQEVRLFAS